VCAKFFSSPWKRPLWHFVSPGESAAALCNFFGPFGGCGNEVFAPGFFFCFVPWGGFFLRTQANLGPAPLFSPAGFFFGGGGVFFFTPLWGLKPALGVLFLFSPPLYSRVFFFGVVWKFFFFFFGLNSPLGNQNAAGPPPPKIFWKPPPPRLFFWSPPPPPLFFWGFFFFFFFCFFYDYEVEIFFPGN